MKITRMIYKLTMWRSKKAITAEYGPEFWMKFCALSEQWLCNIMPKVPDIGDSIFLFNYAFCPCYIAWYRSFLELGLSADITMQHIWTMNEQLVKNIAKPFMKFSVHVYIGRFRKKAQTHENRSRSNTTHPYDWKVRYREIDKKTFQLDIYECGMLKLSRDFDALGMFPMLCRMDYLFSHYMGNGFKRTKTLGDGDDCCNCRYILGGSCEWSPEKGFLNRK